MLLNGPEKVESCDGLRNMTGWPDQSKVAKPDLAIISFIMYGTGVCMMSKQAGWPPTISNLPTGCVVPPPLDAPGRLLARATTVPVLSGDCPS